ncbi:Hsp20/alpha crystallin family protein [Panacibacter ginsenosidivorans]|uniref:Hsp20/alpha crystallin family protein n=1 Tax=Panacibacter ginsenosidivorans TaxID=1813871 RepID=A0A5B8V632_9BACT|nr:Hsp20/alpha crystallin family protein [Panacibacter ginsenosidivorans]QEC66096.1 Hsp20/alpha crystallin family protein [Panacibacter ginsenosidivorans]
MTLTKHNYRNVNDLFDEFFRPNVWGKETGLTVPPVNIHETNDSYHVELVAPGLNKEDFKVNLEKGLLTISYEKKAESENKDYKTHRKEFSVTSFKRSFSVDDKINAEGIQAKYENGVLKLLLPKKEEIKVQPKEIAIQ